MGKTRAGWGDLECQQWGRRGLGTALRIECQGNKIFCPFTVRQLQFSWTVAYVAAFSKDMTWIEMHACLSVTLSSTSLPPLIYPGPTALGDYHREGEGRGWIPSTGPPRPQWLAVETAPGRWPCCCLCSEIPECQRLALTGVQLAAPTERPVEASVTNVVPGIWAWLPETHLAGDMFSYRKSWVFSPSCLSVCALGFVSCWVRFISTNVYTVDVKMNKMQPLPRVGDRYEDW